MTRQAQTSPGLLWRARPGEPAPPREQNRLPAIFEGFEAKGARAVALPFSEEAALEIRKQIGELDAVLTWVDPIVAGRDRSVLDALLREASETGVYVSAHPDVIQKMGTKEALVRTRDREWSTNFPWAFTTRPLAAAWNTPRSGRTPGPLLGMQATRSG